MSISIQWSYRLLVTIDGQTEVIIPVSGEEQLFDKNTGIIFAAKELGDQLVQLHRIEDSVDQQAEMDKQQDFVFSLQAPQDRYLLMQKDEAILRAVQVCGRVEKRGSQITLQQGIIGDTRFAYAKGTMSGGTYIIATTEEADHNVQASLHFSPSQGGEQIIKLEPSSALAVQLKTLRENE